LKRNADSHEVRALAVNTTESKIIDNFPEGVACLFPTNTAYTMGYCNKTALELF
jgi:hypothetical protein